MQEYSRGWLDCLFACRRSPENPQVSCAWDGKGRHGVAQSAHDGVDDVVEGQQDRNKPLQRVNSEVNGSGGVL